MTVQRVDALEAGIIFMTWVFSDGRAFANDVSQFTTNIGMSWSEVEGSLNKENGAVRLIEGIKRASSSMGSQVFAWFEVGRNAILLSNMVATGAPSSLIDAALSGYRCCLEDAHIRIEERDRLQALLNEMANGSLEEKTIALGQLKERLRDQALIQDEERVVNNINISHVSNSILNVMSQLDHVSQCIQTAPALSSEKREELAKLILDLKSAIGTTPQSHEEDAEIVAEQANDLSEELRRQEPRLKKLPVIASGLVEATKALATVVPSAIETAKAIAAFVANLSG